MPTAHTIAQAVSQDPEISFSPACTQRFVLEQLRADKKTQAEYWEKLHGMNVVSEAYIAERENLPSRRRRNLCQPRWPRSRTAKVLSAPPLYHQAMATESRLVEFRDMEVKAATSRRRGRVRHAVERQAGGRARVRRRGGRGALRNALGLGENIPVVALTAATSCWRPPKPER